MEDTMKSVKYVQNKALLPSETKLGLVHLNVMNLENQIKFYTYVLKMTLHEQGDDYAVLGDEEHGILRLKQIDNAQRYHATTGMYHFALLYPNEKELAKAISWLFSINYPNSPTDHGMSKTTYLEDLEGNHIELYIRTIDRGEYVYTNNRLYMRYYSDGRLTDGRDPLDMDELFSHIDENEQINTPLSNMAMGHIHLYGSELDEMVHFYEDVIGFAEGVVDYTFKMADMGLDNIQNHVIAFNMWKNTDVQSPKNALGLDFYTILVPSRTVLDEVKARLANASWEFENFGDRIALRDVSKIKLEIKVA